ncbi:IclR family transcriptional regulator [Calidifontibacter sp. DB0510]|uniref:IclR family transcriptional regulator n=2 Tax=Metallococcus carri TaxID=1656884 RepID=A0A967ED04_9MICO|nr:IclR family transcriptional regulator [Metallococcus carri]NOP36919.1 IclR family transcriptional regulator [Calidifontibacter sp. DB2511S]
MAAEGKSVVPAVARAVAILDLLTTTGSRGLTLTEIARSLGIAKSSTANLCAELEEQGLISHSGEGYRLGRKLVSLAGAYLGQVDQVDEFYTQCRRSKYVSAEAARLSMLDGLDVLYLARFDGSQPIRLTANIGDRLPAHITATGKALLATLPEAAVRDRYQGRPLSPGFTAKSHSTLGSLLADLRECRQRGYALDDEETTPGVLCVAVPVIDVPDQPARFAVSATILKAREHEIGVPRLVDELVEIAAAISVPLRARS